MKKKTLLQIKELRINRPFNKLKSERYSNELNELLNIDFVIKK